MSYDLIRHAYYSLNHPEGESLSVQSPLYRLKTQIAERYLGESLGESYMKQNKKRKQFLKSAHCRLEIIFKAHFD